MSVRHPRHVCFGCSTALVPQRRETHGFVVRRARCPVCGLRHVTKDVKRPLAFKPTERFAR